MNELLQKHGCSNVFNVPVGLRELMSDITREVLREQPAKMFDFIANYLSVLLITREHGIMAVKILDDLCDCRPSVSEHLMILGLERQQASAIAEVIHEEIENAGPTEEGQEKVKESQILKKVLTRHVLDEEMTAKISQVARNAYRDYWYRKQLLEQSLKESPDQPWEIAAQHTLNIYKKTKPSFDDLARATQLIQAAYRGYYVRRNILRHLKHKPKPKSGPKVELPGPPIDVADSREIDLGRVINIKVKEDNTGVMFDMKVSDQLGLSYDPMTTITHLEDDRFLSSKSIGGKLGVSSLHQTGSKEHHASQPSAILAEAPLSYRHSISAVPPETADVAARKASVVSQAQSQGRFPDAESSHLLKFTDEPPEVIVDEKVEEIVDEEAQVAEAEPKKSEVQTAQSRHSVVQLDNQEVQEAIAEEVPADADVAQEVPEELTDVGVEDDGASGPESSIATTAPVTDDTTDVEDAGDLNTTGEEEGE